MSELPSFRIDRAPPGGWAELAASSGGFYHHPRWIEAIGSSFNYPVYYAVASDRHGALTALLPLAVVPSLTGKRRLVSFPFSYAAGVVGEDRRSAEVVMREAVELAMRLRCHRMEIKQGPGVGDPFPALHRAVHYRAYRIDTSGGSDAVWQRLHPDSTRRGIRKAEKQGVRVTRADSESDWRVMARLQEATSHSHGTPAPPEWFFTRVCRGLQQDGLADLWLAAPPNGPVIAGITVWTGLREWIYSFGASKPESLDLRPNHLLLWRALERACERGVGFDLGRAAPEQKGLVQFKERWGAQPVDLPYDYWPALGGLNVQDRSRGPLALAAAAWRKLPAPVARWGSRLYRYLG